MATLISVEAEDGTVHGSCDAKCYNAMGPECSCICRGANHSVGREIAMARTRDLAADHAEREAAAGEADAGTDRLVFLLPDLEADAEAEWEAEPG